jgi:hypothetical protein
MAAISSPYGAQPISSQVGNVRPMRIPLGIASGLSSNIFKWQPVKLVASGGTAGTLTPCTVTTDPIFGIFAGVEYTPTGGRPAVSPFWASGTTYDSTLDMFAYVWPAWLPDMRIKIQADGTVPQTLLGSSFNFSNFSAGSTTVGLSQCTAAHAGVAASSQGQLTLVEFATDVGDAVGDAFTDLICIIALPQIGPAPQTSIG